jgi:hypothetical protein
MPYIRHELGKRLRIRRIPELHVRLDDSAERGTRVLHLLQELEAGVDPEAITPINESLPTPVPRLPHEGDAEPVEDVPPAVPPAPAGPRPAARRGPGRGPYRGPAGRGAPAKGSHRTSRKRHP